MSRAALFEIEYITNQKVDTWLNGAAGVANTRVLSIAMAEAAYADFCVRSVQISP